MSSKNLFFSLIDAEPYNMEVTYESIIENVNNQSRGKVSDELGFEEGLSTDDYTASELNYDENYTKKQLELIAKYYGISVRKMKKGELIEIIVVFEKEYSNHHIVGKRKTLWFYMEEINSDEFLSKFLILD